MGLSGAPRFIQHLGSQTLNANYKKHASHRCDSPKLPHILPNPPAWGAGAQWVRSPELRQRWSTWQATPSTYGRYDDSVTRVLPTEGGLCLRILNMPFKTITTDEIGIATLKHICYLHAHSEKK